MTESKLRQALEEMLWVADQIEQCGPKFERLKTGANIHAVQGLKALIGGYGLRLRRKARAALEEPPTPTCPTCNARAGDDCGLAMAVCDWQDKEAEKDQGLGPVGSGDTERDSSGTGSGPPAPATELRPVFDMGTEA